MILLCFDDDVEMVYKMLYFSIKNHNDAIKQILHSQLAIKLL